MLEAIKFEHTVFALPFAYIAMVLAAGGWPDWWTVAWVTLAMAGGRTCAMAANRVIDRAIDAGNPRTAGRHLPSGVLRARELKALAAAGAAVMVLSAAMLNPLCLALAPAALVFLVGYSYTKYVTWTSHWILGFTDGIAAGGGWIAVSGRFEAPALVLWFALTVWIAGFDVIYACQDVEFDRAARLHSIPARWGVRAALRIAVVSHALMVGCLLALWQVAALGPVFLIGVVAVAVLLAYEHWLVRPDDLTRVNVAFFQVNAVVSVGLFAVGLADVLLGR